MRKFVSLVGLLSCCVAGTAQACSCDPISPSAGFDRAQYVFTGKIATADPHSWVVDVDRVWKGKLSRTIKLMDVYGSIDCEFFFQLGKSYLFFAIIAKGGREVFYHPQVIQRASQVFTHFTLRKQRKKDAQKQRSIGSSPG